MELFKRLKIYLTKKETSDFRSLSLFFVSSVGLPHIAKVDNYFFFIQKWWQVCNHSALSQPIKGKVLPHVIIPFPRIEQTTILIFKPYQIINSYLK